MKMSSRQYGIVVLINVEANAFDIPEASHCWIKALVYLDIQRDIKQKEPSLLLGYLFCDWDVGISADHLSNLSGPILTLANALVLDDSIWQDGWVAEDSLKRSK